MATKKPAKKQASDRPLTRGELERRQKLRERMQARWADPDFRANFRGGRRKVPIKKIEAEKRKAEARAAKEAVKAEARKPKPYVAPGVIAPAVVAKVPSTSATGFSMIKVPPENAVEVITEAAALGCTMGQISAAFGIDATTLRKWREEYPEIRDALVEGRVREEGILVGALMSKALEGNVTAAIFLLKARHQYTDSGAPLTANSVSINFTLPGSLSPKEYVENITASAQVVEPEVARKLIGNRKVKSALENESRHMRRGDEAEGDGNDY